MPILAREPDCYPGDLLDALAFGPREALARDPQEEGRGWWLVYTQARREKDLMRRLSAGKVPFYCPIVSRRGRAASGRVRESYVPLFPSYVFVYGTPDDRVTALTTNCVSSITPVRDQGQLTHELVAIRRLLASSLPIMPEERLERGMPVRVVTGPLRGQEGIVIERLGRRRLLVTVELLQRGASVDLDECDVAAI